MKNSSDGAVAPFSVGKIRKSRMVFGDIVLDEEDAVNQSTHSLIYSPSPVADAEQKSRDEYSPVHIQFDNNKGASTTSNNTKPKSSVTKQPFEPVIGSGDSAKENVPENVAVTKGNMLKATPRPVVKKTIQQRSALRRDLGKSTQAAIDSATKSINQTLNAAQKAKKEARQDIAKKTSKTRITWKKDLEEAMDFNADAEKIRHEQLALQRQMSSMVFKAKAKSQLDNKQAHLNAIEKESQFKSDVFRDHQRKLRQEQERKRRASIEARAKLRQNHRAGEEKLRMKAIQEDQVLMEERHLGSLAGREYKKREAEKRRKSYSFRNGDARRIRQLHAAMEKERKDKEHESYELKWAGEKDAEAYNKQVAQQRRDSLAFRNMEGRKQRDEESDRRSQEEKAQHASYELKWAGEKDAEAYKKQMADERRDSFAFRNQEGRRQREEEAERRIAKANEEHASYELKWEAERDAENYKRQMEEERRKSLAFRNKQRKQHQEIMEELQSIAHEKEAESLALKWAGENDAKAYLADLEEQRRQSLHFRNQEGRRHRELDAEAHQKEVQAAHEEEELQSGCREDVQNYKKQCAARDRASLVFRGKESELRRLHEVNERQLQQEQDEKNRELEDKARADVKQYLEECKKRRRMSLAFRAKEKRHHAKLEKKQRELEREERHRITHDQAMDRRMIELERQKEKARVAMDAIRHAGGYSFSGKNPFAAILES